MFNVCIIKGEIIPEVLIYFCRKISSKFFIFISLNWVSILKNSL